jgi:hypothetical protein
MPCARLKPLAVLAFLVIILHAVAGSGHGQMLDQRIANEQTKFIPRDDTPLNQYVEIAQQLKIPMGIEWTQEPEQSTRQHIDFLGGTIRELLRAVCPNSGLRSQGGLLHVAFPKTVAHSPLNFLNLRIPGYSAINEPLFVAEGLLRTRINMVLYPELYRSGFGGGYGGGGTPFSLRSITFSGDDLTIRDILSGIAESHGNALWVVQLSHDELAGTKPKWEGIPQNKQGQSPLSNRWKFIPLVKEQAGE